MVVLGMLVALLLTCLACLPGWPYSARWSYYPSAALGFLAATIALLVHTGYL